MRLFVDANVLFTAAYSPKGKSAILLESLSHLIISSDYALEEARRNLALKRHESLVRFEKIALEIEIVPSVGNMICPIKLPTKDVPIFLAAVGAKATHLLTGDIKDFGVHMNKPEKSLNILIQTVNDFLKSAE